MKDRLFTAPGTWALSKCTNPGCGGIWLDPRPADIDLSMAYENYYTHQDLDKSNSLIGRLYRRAKRGYLFSQFRFKTQQVSILDRLLGHFFWLLPARRYRIQFGFEFLKGRQKGKLLELGCGAGSLLADLRDWGWQAQGIDVDKKAIAHAATKGLDVSVGDVLSKNFPRSHFDAIISSHVIEHLPDPRATLAECRRILKPNGLLISATPNAKSWAHKMFAESWLALDPPRHLFIHTESSVRRLFEESGLKVLSIGTSIRSADELILASQDIRSTGHHHFGSYRPLRLLLAQVIVLIAALRLLVRPLEGEELIITAIRSE